MRGTTLVWVLLVMWAVASVASLWMLFLAEPTGDGFTRGMNRLFGFILWQCLAALIAIAVWWAGKRLPASGLKWLSRIPGILAVALASLVVATILWVRATKPASDVAPAAPVTQPVDS